MKRRDLLLAVPAVAMAIPQISKGAADAKLDKQVLAMMLLLMKSKGSTGSPSYPNIDALANKSQADAAKVDPQFGKFNSTVYSKAQALINTVGPTAKGHQKVTRSLSLAVQPNEYPDNECPIWDSIDVAINALLT